MSRWLRCGRPEYSKYMPDKRLPPRALASWCLDAYSEHIEGQLGLAHVFDYGMDNFRNVAGLAVPRHVQDPGQLARSVGRFRAYAATIEGFKGRPVSDNSPAWLSEDFVEQPLTREITPDLIQTYQQFGNALNDYSGIISAVRYRKTPLDNAIGAAIKVCKITNPGQWDPEVDLCLVTDPGQRNPDAGPNSAAYHVKPVLDESPRRYLEAFISQQ